MTTPTTTVTFLHASDAGRGWGHYVCNICETAFVARVAPMPYAPPADSIESTDLAHCPEHSPECVRCRCGAHITADTIQAADERYQLDAREAEDK